MFLGSVASKPFGSNFELTSRVAELDMSKNGDDSSENGLGYQLNSLAVDELAEVAKPIAKVNLANDGGMDMMEEVDAHENVAMAVISPLSLSASRDISRTKSIGGVGEGKND